MDLLTIDNAAAEKKAREEAERKKRQEQQERATLANLKGKYEGEGAA